jgi:soluble lytic murein transglycosylase
MRVARRRRRSRRLLRLVIPLILLAIIVVVGVTVLTGRLIVPKVSGSLYPIRYEKEIAAVAKKYDVNPYLLAAVARTESGFNPEAASHDGAVGLMQLLPGTAKWVTGLDSWKGPANPALTDPQDSLELGACYLSYLMRTIANSTAALAAYNAGQGIVGDWMKAAGGADSFGPEDIKYPETKEFVRRVEHYRSLFEASHPDAFSTTGSSA